jgi:hypothetical protein
MSDTPDMPEVDAESVVGVDADDRPVFQLPWTGEIVHKSAVDIMTKAFANDEPVFVLRAKDFFAVQVVVHYQQLIETVGPNNLELQEDMAKLVKAFRDWQGSHMGQVRYPD